MGNLQGVVTNMLESILPGEDSNTQDGDYIGAGGLLYCGKCKTRKQIIVDAPEGIFKQKGKIKISCQCKCQTEEREKRQEREQYEEEMARIQRMRDASLMDAKYRDARFENYQVTANNRKAYNLASNYCKEFKKMYSENQGIFLYGPVGTGKSYTAACIGNELLEHNVSVIMTSFVKILQNIEENKKEAEYIAMLNSAKLLILDDFGTERSTDYALEKVYNIIDSRSRVSKPMVITSNLSLADMLDVKDIRYKRIYDRIIETCFPAEIPGDSLRRATAEERYDRMARFMEG